jgi:hypothetical protein
MGEVFDHSNFEYDPELDRSPSQILLAGGPRNINANRPTAKKFTHESRATVLTSHVGSILCIDNRTNVAKAE